MITLANTAVAPATYGDSTHVGQFTVDQQGRLTFAANVAISATPALTNNHIFVGNGSNVATDVAMSGDATIVASGALTVGANKIQEGKLDLSDVTTFNVTTARHGFAPKAPNDASKFLDGTGAYTTPSGFAPGGAPYYPGYQAGRFYGTPYASSGGTRTTAANILYAAPFYCAVATTFTKIGFRCTSGGAGNFELGIYNNNNGIPGTLFHDFGSTVVTTSSFVANTLTGQTITLAVGWYWLAVAFSSASVACQVVVGTEAGNFLGVTDPNAFAIDLSGAWTYSAGNLPSPFPTPVYGASTTIRILLGL